MCVCEKPRPNQTLPRCESTEWEGDVELLVGWDPVWRFAAKRDILAASSPVFEALFQGPLATSDFTIAVSDVEPRAFDYLLRFLYGKEVKLQSVAVALNTLYAAHKYLVPGLVELCVQYLTVCLTVDSVLEIYRHACQYSSPSPLQDSPGRERKHYTPTAPKAPVEPQSPPEPAGITGWSDVLLTKCLDFLDTHAEMVLRLEDVEDLDAAALQELLQRDTLACPEPVIWTVLERWSERECRRQRLPPTPANRRQVLGDLIYHVRFLSLSSDEFIRGPLQSELLDPEELKFLSALVSGAPPPAAPPRLQPHLSRIQRPRLSARASVPTTDLKRPETGFRSKSWRRVGKEKASKPSRQSGKPEKEKRCTGSCITDSIVDVLTCIFD